MSAHSSSVPHRRCPRSRRHLRNCERNYCSETRHAAQGLESLRNAHRFEKDNTRTRIKYHGQDLFFGKQVHSTWAEKMVKIIQTVLLNSGYMNQLACPTKALYNSMCTIPRESRFYFKTRVGHHYIPWRRNTTSPLIPIFTCIAALCLLSRR